MSQEQKKRPPMTEEERQRRIERLRRERRRKRRQQAMIMRAAVLGVLILILIGSIALVSAQVRRSKAKKAEVHNCLPVFHGPDHHVQRGRTVSREWKAIPS